MRTDGRLDEAIYQEVAPMGDFIQIEPQPGQPASERTDVWVFYDRDRVYVTIRCWESEPARIIGNEFRRDNTNTLVGNDQVAFVFDTFYDHRNGVMFGANAAGGRVDGDFSNMQYNADYNPVWYLATGRFEGGWVFEAAVPFKTIRYREGPNQVWGFNVQRSTPWRNEWTYLTRIPASYANRGIMQTALAATLVGLEVPKGSKNIEIKPFVIGSLATDRLATSPLSNDLDGNAGVDVKYGITRNLTADLTYKTDFAQVEVDEQQINLTRFSLFFPEKRDFFLENQGVFAFGGVPQSSQAGDSPLLFYSRRIGLEQGRAVAIDGGGRMTGRVGRYSIGLLNIHAKEDEALRTPPTGFSAIRVKRDVFRRSSIGALMTSRSRSALGGSSQTYGADATFLLFDNLNVNTYWARTRTEAFTSGDVSYRAQLDYAADRYGVQLERLQVGEHFNPEVGFVRRPNMKKTHGQFRFSPRLADRNAAVRRYVFVGTAWFIENLAGQLESRDVNGEFDVEFRNGDKFIAVYDRAYEFLARPFAIAPGVSIPPGSYPFSSARAGFTLGPRRKLSGAVLLDVGEFYDGRKVGLNVTRGRLEVTRRLSMEPSLTLNWISVASAPSFRTELVGSRITYGITPWMFISALVQYNNATSAVGANVRLRWEYQPGSELFVVVNEQRDTRAPSFPELANRSFIVKVNRLFRF
jgi:hypothetical protein